MTVHFPTPPLVSRLRSLQDPLCVAVAATTAGLLLEQAAALLPRFPFLELRLDLLAAPRTGPDVVRALAERHPSAILLATCRPQRSGGGLQAGAAEEVAVLREAAQAGAAVLDLSLETTDELGSAAVDALRATGAAVLLSFHDFGGMADLQAVLHRMQTFRPDLCKLVPTANTLDDSLTVLQFLATQGRAGLPVVAMAMGEPGVPSRVLGPSRGSLFTFAAASADASTAPGQFPADKLRDLYRIGEIGPATRLYGVFGNPVHSSLSPRMLNTAFRACGLDAVYLPLKAENAAEVLRVAEALPLSGFSVTMPFKQSVMPLLHSVDPLAARLGAVNTVHRTPDGRLHGYNTDAAGIAVPLEQRRSLHGARVLVLGAGGAARAAVFACAEREAQVSLHNRTLATAETLAREAGATVVPTETLAREDFDVLIHATPAGMRGNPHALPLAPDQLRAALVFDLVYNPTDTPLLRLAREQGRDVIRGVEMFVHQGARQFERWTGLDAPVDAMRTVVEQALNLRRST